MATTTGYKVGDIAALFGSPATAAPKEGLAALFSENSKKKLKRQERPSKAADEAYVQQVLEKAKQKEKAKRRGGGSAVESGSSNGAGGSTAGAGGKKRKKKEGGQVGTEDEEPATQHALKKSKGAKGGAAARRTEEVDSHDSNDEDGDDDGEEEEDEEIEKTSKKKQKHKKEGGAEEEKESVSTAEGTSSSSSQKKTASTTGGGDVNEEESDEAREARTIFVGNLPLTASSKAIKKLFKPCGVVEAVRLRSVAVAGAKVDEHGNQKLVKRVCVNKGLFDKDTKDSVNAYVVFREDGQPSTKKQRRNKKGGDEKEAEDAEEGGSGGGGDDDGDAGGSGRGGEAAVIEALKLNGTLFEGKHIRVDRVNPVMDSSRSVFLGGVPFTASEEEIWEHFAAKLPDGGQSIEAVRLVRDKETQLGKGFGYVLFRNKGAVAAAIQLNECPLAAGGVTRNIRVQVCGKRTKGGKGSKKPKGKVSSLGADGGGGGDAAAGNSDGVEGKIEKAKGAARRILGKEKKGMQLVRGNSRGGSGGAGKGAKNPHAAKKKKGLSSGQLAKKVARRQNMGGKK